MLIDTHAHIGRVYPERHRMLDVNDLITKMDRWGIDKSVVMCLSEHPEAEYLESDTEDVIRESSKYPDRLIPSCLIDPRFGKNHPTMDFGYLLEEYVARGCKCMGEMLPKMQIDDERCINLFRQAGKFGLAVIIDMNDNEYYYGLRDRSGLPGLETMLQECPETIVVGHGPTFWAEISGDPDADTRTGYPKGPVKPGGAVPRLLAQYDNLWADLSAGSGYNGINRDIHFGLEFLEQFQDKLMFATDSCQRYTEAPENPNVNYFTALRTEHPFPEDAWNKIASENAIRLMGLEG